MKRSGFLPKDTPAGMSFFLCNISLPCLLFRAIATLDVSTLDVAIIGSIAAAKVWLGLLGKAVVGSPARASAGYLARRVIWWKVELVASRRVRGVSFSVLQTPMSPLRCQTGKLKSELLETN